ncbi:lantibiotic dehydratase [Streptomyces sp. NPDC016845]|uniref:lantibiotic dehydratase n=1 Tax=Streptomyces sp. NPDC016845 TaxID=3364972 RepID=UPI003794D6AC
MKVETQIPYYRPTGAGMLRASVQAAGAASPPWPGIEAERWCEWLAAIWANRSTAEAVWMASPALAESVGAVLAGRAVSAVRMRRMTVALARYLVRMEGRATPFGTFAGVTALQFGARAQAEWTDGHRVRVRPDALWLADVIAQLESCSALRARLPVTTNDATTVRGGRLVVSVPPHASADRPEGEVSILLVPVVRTIMSTARSPVRAGDVVDKVAAQYPGAPAAAVTALVGELMTHGVLISSLRPPSTTVDTLGHLVDRLAEVDATAVPEVASLARELCLLRAQLNGVDGSDLGAQAASRRGIATRMRALAGTVRQPFTVDLRLGATMVLPQEVAGEAAAAAEALVKLSPAPAGSAAWREYHGRFLDRYGPGTPVPVDQLVDGTVGLGFPRHFSEGQDEVREFSPRDQALLALAQRAALDGEMEVALDDERLDTLSVPGERRPVAPADLWADVRASTVAALDAGDFTLGVCGFGRFAAGTGRFLDLLDAPDRRRVHAAYATSSTGVDGALAAQLSFPPRHVGQESVQRVEPVLPQVIRLAEHGGSADGRIALQDLAVTADQKRLYVVSLSRGRVVVPVLAHAGARHTMPPVARLLLEIPRADQPQLTSFDWGAAACLPFLPRLRRGRSILAPARWRLTPADLPRSSAAGDWTAAWEAIRERRRLPMSIAVGSGDQQLRLDLHNVMHRDLLRTYLQSSGPTVVTEAPTGADHAWCGGRAHEIVVSLAANAPPAAAPAFLAGAGLPPPVPPSPRGGVAYAKLYGPSDVFDMLLTEHVPALLSRWVMPPQWWFIRYRSPRPHLRIRVHDPDAACAAGRVAAWADGLRQRGLISEFTFDTYHPETGRYGSATALTAAEALFAADTAAVTAQLGALAATDLHPQALTAASLVNLSAAMTGSHSAAMRWLMNHPQLAADLPLRDRGLRRQTLRLADDPSLHRTPGADAVAAAWATRTAAAHRYTARLTAETSRLTPDTVLTSLLHMHHNRALGCDPASEATTHKLARCVALTHAARHRTDQEDGPAC